MLTGDFLAAGDAIEQRLRDRVTDLRQVLSAADLEGVQESRQAVPAAHVLFSDYTVAEAPGFGEKARVRQTWVVVIVDRNVRQTNQAAAQRAAIGPRVLAVMQTLMGWAPTAQHSALVLTDSPFQTAYSNGFIYVPVAFYSDVKIAGDQ